MAVQQKDMLLFYFFRADCAPYLLYRLLEQISFSAKFFHDVNVVNITQMDIK